jgi:flagellar hook-length control protein FliK
MTDPMGVTAVASASHAPEPFTRTTRLADSEFLPVLRELSSSEPHPAERRAPDSARDGQADAPGHDDGEDTASPADDTNASREPARTPAPSLDVAALLLGLVQPLMVSTEIPALTPTASPDGAPALAQVTATASTALGIDVPSIDVASTGNIARPARPAAVPDAGAVSQGVAMAPRPGVVLDPGAVNQGVAVAPKPAVVPDFDTVIHGAAATPGTPAPSPEATRVLSAAATTVTPDMLLASEVATESSAAIEGLRPMAEEVRGTARVTTALGTSIATDLRLQRALVQEVAATAHNDWTAHEEGGDRGRDSDATRQGTDTSLAPSAGVAEPRTSTTVDAPEAPEPAVAPRPVVDQITQRVLLISRDGRHEVSMRLEPPELGALRIDAVLTGGQLRLDIRTEGEPTRDLLEQALPRLREALSQHGITTDRVTVQVGLDSGPREFSRNGGDAFRPMPQVVRSVALPRSAPTAPVWRDAVTDGFDIWV